MKNPPMLSNCKYIARIYQADHAPREIHYDGLQILTHGFLFAREDHSTEFVNVRVVDGMETMPATQITGPAQ